MQYSVNMYQSALPVCDLFLPPFLSSEGVAFISPPSADVRVIWDSTPRFSHPP